MEYVFSANPILNDYKGNVVIFKGDNALGQILNGSIVIEDSLYRYSYKNCMWYLENKSKEDSILYECGGGASPVLQIENLKIVNEKIFLAISYIPPIENKE